jgi:hypothetical protein
MGLIRYCFVNSLSEAGEFWISHLTVFNPVGAAGGVVSLFNTFMVTLPFQPAPLSSVTFKVAV